MSGYSSHMITVDGIPSVHRAYGEQGPHTIRQFFDIYDDSPETIIDDGEANLRRGPDRYMVWKSVYVYISDFVVDEEYYLQTGHIRDIRNQEYYAGIVEESLHNWKSSIIEANINYEQNDEAVYVASGIEGSSRMAGIKQEV